MGHSCLLGRLVMHLVRQRLLRPQGRTLVLRCATALLARLLGHLQLLVIHLLRLAPGEGFASGSGSLCGPVEPSYLRKGGPTMRRAGGMASDMFARELRTEHPWRLQSAIINARFTPVLHEPAVWL